MHDYTVNEMVGVCTWLLKGDPSLTLRYDFGCIVFRISFSLSLFSQYLRPARIKLKQDVRKLVELLEQYNVNMAETFISQPKMLTLQGK